MSAVISDGMLCLRHVHVWQRHGTGSKTCMIEFAWSVASCAFRSYV